MSDLNGNLGHQPQTVLDSGLPYPKPITEDEIKTQEETRKEQLKRAAGKKPEKNKEKDKEKDKEKEKEHSKKKKVKEEESEYVRRSSIQSWFNTFMIMNIPVVGWIYLLVLALRRNGDQKKDFARAYLVYKLVFLLVALGIIIIALYTGMEAADRLLRYMNML